MVESDYYKKYYAKNRDRLLKYQKEKITCDVCGSKFVKSHKNGHLSTNKHKNALKKLGGVNNKNNEVTPNDLMKQIKNIEKMLAEVINAQ